MANYTGLKKEELTTWLKYTADSLAGKPGEYTDDQKKQIESLAHRKPNMNDVTSTAHLVADTMLLDVHRDIEMLQSTVGLLMNIIQDKLDLTDEEFQDYAKQYQEQIKELEQEKKQQAQQKHEKEEEQQNKENNNEKVVKLKEDK